MKIETPSHKTPQFGASDWFLQHLVSLVNDTPLQLPITLQVSGMLVSGQLVSGACYFEGIAGDFAHGIAAYPDVAASVRESFTSLGTTIYKTDPNDTAPGPAPHFLHLQNAQFFGPAAQPIPQTGGMWWRGRVTEVGGFSLGQLVAQP
jgi:hypothetical protein